VRQVVWVVASIGVSLIAGLQRSARMRERRAEAALRESEEHVRLAALAADIGVWSWLPGTSTVTVGARWREIFGAAPDATITFDTWRDALHPDDRQRAVRELNEANDAHRDFDVEYRVLRPDGTVRWIADRGRAYYDASGRPVRMGGINVEITALKQAEAALREADRRKNEFLGMLSHELRNPLAPIRNSVFILRRAEAGGAQARRAQDVIERQVEHLTRLVDDLLDVTRIARGKIQLRRERVDLREVVRRATDDFRHTMEARGVAFGVQLPDPAWADADATRITQVVGNLLHNAAKFTRTGDEVALSLEVLDGEAVIRVRDTGAGIDEALLPRVFEPFSQGERTLARTEGGLGLGLALVQGITALHGGTVRAASGGTGRGAEFEVRLPLAAGAAREASSAPAARPGRVRRVLVVDDNVDAATSLADVVRLLGHEVEIARDGAGAIAKIGASAPDVLLCDLGLPGMDGYEVARVLRARGTNGMRLVALSGYARPEDVQKAIASGFDAHLAKPPDPAQLARLLL
jgi:PAS domain S-box-containing protein